MLRHASARRFFGSAARWRVVAPVAAVAFVVALGALCVGTSRVNSLPLPSHTPLGTITSDQLVEHAASHAQITDHGTRTRQRSSQAPSVVATPPSASSTHVADDRGRWLVSVEPGLTPLAPRSSSVGLRAPPPVLPSTNP